MPSYLDMLPEDTITHIYRMLYKSVINDMKANGKYKNLVCFDKLLEITKNPYVDTLNYYDYIVNSFIDNIVSKYGGSAGSVGSAGSAGSAGSTGYNIEDHQEDHFYNSLLYSSSLYYKSYYIKPLNFDINKIEIFNFYIYNLYKDDVDNDGLEVFNNKYFATSYYSGITKGINKNGFILEKETSFRCLAEVIFYIIEFYDFIKQILYMNIEIIEQIGGVLNLSPAKIKERGTLIDILNYHINHRFLEGLLYDIKYKCAKPLLE
jgi:hypothetical protein